MRSPIAHFFRRRHHSPYWHCDCCNHNSSVFTLISNEDEVEKRCQKPLRHWFGSLTGKMCRSVAEFGNGSEVTASKRQRLRKAFCLGKMVGGTRKRRFSEPVVIVQNVALKESSSDTPDTHVHNALSSIYTSILDSDITLPMSPNIPTTCFLVHLASDFGTTEHFLPNMLTLPHSATQLDEFASLSYASSWLQASLTRIRDSYSPSSRDIELQMPFVALETDHQCAAARAKKLQMWYSGESVSVVTLDLVVLKEMGCMVSAGHAFAMLRVPVGDVDFEKKLLLWAHDGTDVLDAILAVVEWEERMDGCENRNEGEIGGYSVAKGDRSRTEQSGAERAYANRESKMTNVTSSEDLWAILKDWEAMDKESLLDSDSCWF